jgi:biopolymer transport protein ExbB/TolQ
MVALGLLSIAALAFIVERLFLVRQNYFCPKGLADSAVTHIEADDLDGLLTLAERHPSTLGRIITFIVDHRDNEYEKLTSMAENLGARDIIDQEERTFPLAVVAAVAPLLGLLGTMIGIPAICAFHFFKHKLHKIGVQLDKDVERIITSRFFVKSERPGAGLSAEEPVNG